MHFAGLEIRRDVGIAPYGTAHNLTPQLLTPNS